MRGKLETAGLDTDGKSTGLSRSAKNGSELESDVPLIGDIVWWFEGGNSHKSPIPALVISTTKSMVIARMHVQLDPGKLVKVGVPHVSSPELVDARGNATQKALQVGGWDYHPRFRPKKAPPAEPALPPAPMPYRSPLADPATAEAAQQAILESVDKKSYAELTADLAERFQLRPLDVKGLVEKLGLAEHFGQ